jgi:predicted transcriptional regulator
MEKRSAGRPKKEPGEVLVDLPIKVDPETLQNVQGIADQLDRPRGWVARKLLMRGLEAYSRDLETKRPEIAIQTEEEEELRLVRIRSREGLEELVEEMNDGEPLIKKIKKDQPVNDNLPLENLPPFKPKKGKKT